MRERKAIAVMTVKSMLCKYIHLACEKHIQEHTILLINMHMNYIP